METTEIANGHLRLVVPLDYRDVLRERASNFIYSAVQKRFDDDFRHVEEFARMLSPYLDHPLLNAVSREKVDEVSPYWDNGYFSAGDAAMAYAVIPALKPERVIEIGSGNSTKFMRKAIRDFAVATKITSIDPFPRAEVDQLCDTIVRQSVLEVDLKIFESLKSGDILFHDGSHLTFNGTDTVRLFLEILPMLNPGVIIHLHDIALPFEYISAFDGRGYSEQYMLAAALLFSSTFRVLMPGAYGPAQHLIGKPCLSFWMKKL